jgi:hypothetical protein
VNTKETEMEVTYKVMVRKTVQVKQYEPTVVELSQEGTCPESEARAVRAFVFGQIKDEMNKIFGKAKTETCLE